MSDDAINTKKTILVVEDSKMFAHILGTNIKELTDFDVVITKSFAGLIEIIKAQKHDFFASLLDLNLPDASNGEVVDYVLAHHIPAIVFTSTFDDDLRDNMLSKGIVDYVLKDSPSNVEYIVSLIKQLNRNSYIKALIVDDSKTARNHLTRLLKIYRFNVLEAENGEQGLEVFNKNQDIKLIITDFNMPKMDGFEFTQRIRQLYNRREVAIIGISTYGNNMLSARFLKIGGSDFIAKPFLEEEFFCRLNQNMELLEYITELKYIAMRDYLTGLYNRLHFFDIGAKIYQRACRSEEYIAVAVMDIDFFKAINDTYGHQVGDIVLKKIGKLLSESFRASDMVARLGGEEFCFLLPNIDNISALSVFENMRAKIENTIIMLFDETPLKITVSIGVCTTFEENLDIALNKADKLLYEAKRSGRNKVLLK